MDSRDTPPWPSCGKTVDLGHSVDPGYRWSILARPSGILKQVPGNRKGFVGTLDCSRKRQSLYPGLRDLTP